MRIAHRSFLLVACLLAVLVPVEISAQTCEQDNWDSKFFRPGQIVAHKVAASGGTIYIAGSYWEAYDAGGGDRSVRYVTGIIKFDNNGWHFPSYDNGLNAGGANWSFTDIMVYGNEVIAAGSFTRTNAGDNTIKYIARWDGNQWWPLGSGVNNVVHALATNGSSIIYAGGQFTQAGGEPANYVAQFSGGAWSTLDDPSGTAQGTNSTVFDLELWNNRLVLGGAFTAVGGGTIARHLAGWNWTTGEYEEIGGGTGDVVQLMEAGILGLYVANVDTAGGVPITGVALWDGGSWSDLAAAQFATVQSMDVTSGGVLYASGSYLDTPPGSENRKTARYNSLSSAWEDLLPSCNLDVGCPDMSIDGDTVYVVVPFAPGSIYACNSSTGDIARFDGTEWRGLGEGMTTNGAWGLSLHASDSAMYIGGLYGYMGGVDIHNSIARWSFADDRWHALKGGGVSGVKFAGFDGYVWDVDEIAGNVYAVGAFNVAGTLGVHDIVGYDGNDYFALGGGADYSSTIYAIEEFKGFIYVGGTIFNMTQPGGATQSLGSFVRWTGSQYERPTGSGISGVWDLENAGDWLYIGGQFGATSQNPTANICKYDGAVFDSVGGGVTGRVLDVEVSGADVYVAGGFTQATNPDGSLVACNRLAKWNGGEWQAMGDFNDTVRAVYVRGGEVYAAGHFTMVDGTPARHIAYHDGTSWKAIGEGTDGELTINYGEIYDLESDGDYLWMTGRFSHANNLPSQNIARWRFCGPAPPQFNQGGSGANVNGGTVTLTWDAFGGLAAGGAATTYHVQVAEGDDFSNIIEDASGISGTSHVVNGLSGETSYSWRVRADVDGTVGAWSSRQTFATGVVTAVGDVNDALLPQAFALGQNYPNPFNPETIIEFELPKRSHVRIVVLNLIGQVVGVLADDEFMAGYHTVTWDGRTSDGESAASGMYFYRMTAGDFSASRKMMLLK